jgi:hypothetical protein
MRGHRAEKVGGSAALCSGSACRKGDDYDELKKRLAAEGDLCRFSCVGICAGPVVVVTPPSGAPVVVERVRSRKAQRDVVRLMRGREASDRIRRRMTTGAKRDRAVRRANRS